MRTKNNKALI